MFREYGVDDFVWLAEKNGGGSIAVGGEDAVWSIPIGVFDNRADRTSFLRADPVAWPEDEVDALRESLIEALSQLAGRSVDR